MRWVRNTVVVSVLVVGNAAQAVVDQGWKSDDMGGTGPLPPASIILGCIGAVWGLYSTYQEDGKLGELAMAAYMGFISGAALGLPIALVVGLSGNWFESAGAIFVLWLIYKTVEWLREKTQVPAASDHRPDSSDLEIENHIPKRPALISPSDATAVAPVMKEWSQARLKIYAEAIEEERKAIRADFALRIAEEPDDQSMEYAWMTSSLQQELDDVPNYIYVCRNCRQANRLLHDAGPLVCAKCKQDISQ